MARTGLKVSAELAEQLKGFAESKKAWFTLKIDGETFSYISSGDSLGDNWATLHEQLPADAPVYLVVHLAAKKKWLLIFWCPDDAVVKDRMMYSSSLAAMKQGLPGVEWVDNYRCSEKNEVTLEEYKRATADIDEENLLTLEELTRKEAHADSISTGAMSDSKVSAIVGLPIKLEDEASAAFDAFKSSPGTLVFSLNVKTEALHLESQDSASLEDVSKTLVSDEPRFIVHNFKHEHEGEQKEAIVFFYYCPEEAKPRKKMFYSSCKSVLAGLLKHHHIEVTKSIECSEAGEVSAANSLDELYPKVVVKKSFAKPTRKGVRRPTSKPTFNPDA